MKIKHLRYWLEQTIALSEMSECSRRKFGAIIIDPESNVSLVNGYNGGARGGSSQCAGADQCHRDLMQIESGTQLEVGCNHAESNAIANAARLGIPLLNKWIIVNGEPCLACAKLIHQSGLDRVICIRGVYSSLMGVEYLKPLMQVNLVGLDDDDELGEIINPRRPTPVVKAVTRSPFSSANGMV